LAKSQHNNGFHQGRENHHYNDAKGVQEKKKENAGKSSVTCNQAEPQETAWAWQGKCVYKKIQNS